MNPLASDITEDKNWLLDQQNRLLGYEVFRAFVMADGAFHLEPEQISERTTVNRGLYLKVLDRISKDPELLKKLKNAD